jgi:uncharacterized protein
VTLLVDTNVLVYAIGGAHPLRAPCRRLLEAVAEGRSSATTTPVVIQELVHVRRRRGHDDAVERASDAVELLGPLTGVGHGHALRALRVLAAAPRLGAADALLAAVALEDDLELATADQAFADVPGLRIQLIAPDRST